MPGSDMIGVGIDLVSVARIENMLQRWGDKFLNRVFTRSEIDYCVSKHGPARSLAARFAAKEAFVKAVSTYRRALTESGAGLTESRTGGIRYRDIEVVVDPGGVPAIRAHRAARTALGGLRTALSLSHEHDHAIAIVITTPEVTG